MILSSQLGCLNVEIIQFSKFERKKLKGNINSDYSPGKFRDTQEKLIGVFFLPDQEVKKFPICIRDFTLPVLKLFRSLILLKPQPYDQKLLPNNGVSYRSFQIAAAH